MLDVREAGVDGVELFLERVELGVNFIGEVVELLLYVSGVEVGAHGSSVGIEVVSGY